MRFWTALMLLAASVGCCVGFSGGDDRYIRKYAMMKVYESCFGPEVVKEVRKEMRAACAKCSGVSPTGPGTEAPPTPPPEPTRKGPPKFDPARLQALLAAKPQQHQQHQQQQQVFSPQPGYYPQAAMGPLFYPQVSNAFMAQQYYPQSLYSQNYPQQGFSAQAFQPQGYPQQGYPQQGYPQQGFYQLQRNSRDLDVRGQLETLTSRIGSKVRNVTCVMQELGYLNENLEPNTERMIARITRLPVEDELKKDMIDGIQFCKQFSECIPETKKEKFPMSRELERPMFFFRCYKHRKLEACVMKDVRERYAQSSDIPDDDQITGPEFRSLSDKSTDDKGTSDDMATAMYEFLYGEGESSIDSIM